MNPMADYPAPGVERVENAARKLEQMQEELEREIRAAYVVGGVSLRTLAGAAGMSHESVRRLIRSDQT